MDGVAEVIAALVPEGARVLVVGEEAGPIATSAGNGAASVELEKAATGRLPRGPFDLVVLTGVLGLADDPGAIVDRVRALAGDAMVLIAEPDATLAGSDPAAMAAQRRRRFTRPTLAQAIDGTGLAVTGWARAREGLLVARAVTGDPAAVLASLRAEVEELDVRAAEVAELVDERDALRARVLVLEARERELRERLLAAHDLLAQRDTEVARVFESHRELKTLKGTIVYRAGWRWWRTKLLARKAAARARRELRG